MATNEIRILIRAINQSSKVFKEVEGNFAALAKSAVAAGAILTAFAVAVKKAYDFGKEGAQIERLREAGTKLAASYGTDMEEAVLRIKAASHGAITANAAVSESNRAMLLNVARDSDTIAKLVEIAAIRGRVAGLSAQEAFDRITLGIGRLSTRILDDIGIVVDGETAYAEYGKAIGKVADDLTEAEKRQALTNAIIEDGNELLKQTGGVTDDAANAFERFETHITDATNSLKQHISEGVAPLIRSLDILLFKQNDYNNAIKLHAIDMFKSAKTYEEYEAEMQRVAASQGLVIDSNGDLVKITHSRTGSVKELVQAEYLLSGAMFNANRMTAERDDYVLRLNDSLKEQAERELAVADAIKKFQDIFGLAKDFSFEDAAKFAVGFGEDMVKAGKMTEEALDRMRVEFGMSSESVLAFRDALDAAAKDGIISINELEEAFEPVKLEQAAQRTIELWEEVDDKIRDLRDKFEKDVLDSERELADDMEDAATKRDRDLADLEEDNNRKRDEAIADANKKRQRDEEDAESAHQRRIQKILRKFFYSRLQALMDLDARALWEAEMTRDQELQDAEADRKEKKEQDEKELKDKIEDIESNYEERRQEILRQYDRDIEDAKEADKRRQRDLERALDEQVAEQERYRQEEMDNIEKFLADRWSKEQADYQQRLSDLIEYWQGVLQINELYGGLNSPTPTSDPGYNPPPGDVPVPGEELGDIDLPNIIAGGGIAPVMTSTNGNGSNIVVTLNVTGDAVLASLIRSAAYSAIVDVVAD